MDDVINPRSVLHALSPMGLGTPEVESLTSYFCRLAHSHGMTAVQLAEWILERYGKNVQDGYKWYRRHFTSSDVETERWAAWLAELTGVGDLDQLSLVPWRSVIANSGSSPKSDRWCPCCLTEDRCSEREPYLRLTWDIAPLTVCLKHKVELAHQCPHCKRGNVRNRAALVVPGYCTACGKFLGDAITAAATPEALWIARQVELMVAHPPVRLDDTEGEDTSVANTIRMVVTLMSGGNFSRFAARLGLCKSGVWHWVNRGGLPTIRNWLAISLRGGIPLYRLMEGSLEGWVPAMVPPQLAFALPVSAHKGIPPRVLDWVNITEKLCAILQEEIPVTLADASARIDVDIKLLYLRANREARAISDRYRRFASQRKAMREDELRRKLEEVLSQRLAKGYEGLSARDVRKQLAGTDMANVRNTFAIIKQIRERSNQ